MKFKVEVFLKSVVLDPQGQTVQKATHSLGYRDVRSVRVGKVFLMDIETASEEEGRVIASELADKLLSNTVIETFEVKAVP